MTREQLHIYRVAYRAAWTVAREIGIAMTGEDADVIARNQVAKALNDAYRRGVESEGCN